MGLAKLFVVAAALVGLSAALTPPPGLQDGTYRAYIDEHGREVHELMAFPDGEIPGSSVTTKFITDNDGLKAAANSSAKQALSKRYHDSSDYGFGHGILDSWCGCGFNMDHGNCDAAVADLEYQARNGGSVKLGLSWYSIRGNVVAFVCARWPDSFDKWGKDFEFDGDEIATSYRAITRLCGWYVAGTSCYLDWGETDYNQPLIGYMIWFDGLDFCDASNHSQRETC